MKSNHGSVLIYLVIVLAIVGALSFIGKAIYDAGSDAKQVEWDAANEKQRKAEAEKARLAATRLEKENAKAKVVYRTITQTVDKYIDRPIYRNVCFDADGLRDANAALVGALAPAAKPDKPMPAADSAR